MREQLRAIHEYQVDQSVIDSGIDIKEYQMMLLKRAVGFGNQSFANGLNHSKLQKRVAMMYEKSTSRRSKLLVLALIPAVGAAITVTSIPYIAGMLRTITETLDSRSSDAMASVPEGTQEERVVFIEVEHPADFPGGMDGMTEWLYAHLDYPEEAEKAGIQGRVIIKFVIEADGTVTHPEILRGLSPEVDKEAIRLVSSMPKWTPGKVNGKEVASYFTIPLVFRNDPNGTKK